MSQVLLINVECVNCSLNFCFSESQQHLIALEEQAKAQQLGKWASGTGSEHVREIIWNIENPRHFVDSHHGKPVQGCALYKVPPTFTLNYIVMLTVTKLTFYDLQR